MNKFYTVEQVASILQINIRTLQNRISLQNRKSDNEQQKELLAPPSIKIGRKRLFPVQKLEQWISKFE